ncbi:MULTISPECIES: LacI family DNA-binding transcriptional regulator [unclassified Roseitalea]|uniref:LacI family DNA-binding transcriptional regulator n=1 Tax=unclassified Roseitalea TaxID=2639107 RepID=UPI00273DF677|nr:MULTISPECIES: LacI family DNA-binding transcriptional regulator [unclassified Roseitalea]
MGQKAKTLKDVSKASGLSLITVSRALRQPETVQPATREKVLRTIEAIGYVPNLTARSLVSNRSNMVGLVVPILSSSLFADLAQGVAGVLHERGLQMLLGVSERSSELESEAVRTFIGRQADAIIVTGFTHTESCRSHLQAFSGPVVETWNLRADAVDIAVGYDNRRAAKEMTRYLIGRGYRRIALVGGAFENNDQAEDRMAGFLSAMAEAGRSVPDDHVISVPNPTTMESGYATMERLLALDPAPDAVFFQAEIPAHGAVMACMAMGVAIPDRVAIAGFGDLKLSALLPVPLTTIRIKAEQIGETAARLVLDRLDGMEPDTRMVDVGYDLIIRESA